MQFEPSPDLSQPLLDAVALFEELQIGYALIGGIAAMLYGRARFTDDIDFVATMDHEDRLRRGSDAMQRHHFDPQCTWKLYHASGPEIDLWKDEHAADIVSRAVVTQLAGRAIRVAEPHDLIAMKLRADRPQDDYDISQIVQHTPIDDSIVEGRVTAAQFEWYRQIRQRIEKAGT